MSLFNNKKEERHEDVQVRDSSIIGKGTSILGDIDTSGNIRIDGRLKGNLRSKSKVALGNGSAVEGNVFAQNAEIEGDVIGDIEIGDLLVLKPTANIQGNISTGRLVIESGAKFNGSCRMGEGLRNTAKLETGKPNESVKAKATA